MRLTYAKIMPFEPIIYFLAQFQKAIFPDTSERHSCSLLCGSVPQYSNFEVISELGRMRAMATLAQVPSTDSPLSDYLEYVSVTTPCSFPDPTHACAYKFPPYRYTDRTVGRA